MIRAGKSAVLVALLTAAIGFTMLLWRSHQEAQSAQRQVAALDARVSALEEQLRVDGSDAGPSRSLQAEDVVSADDIARLLSEPNLDLSNLLEASLRDSPFFGFPLDDEFGGIVISGNSDQATVLLQGQALNELPSVVFLLKEAGFSSEVIEGLSTSPSSGDESQGMLRINWTHDPQQIELTLSAGGN